MERRDKPVDLTQDEAPRLTIVNKHPRPLAGATHIRDSAQFERENADRQHKARVQRGIDWDICLVPGCGRKLYSPLEGNVPPEYRDPDVWLPMCQRHAAVVWRNVNSVWKNPSVQLDMLGAHERHTEQVQQREERARQPEGPGSIYMLRQNGLIKVGWASNLERRLKAYGPNVEILCHYQGSRDDETSLHRQLRPSLAKGREWYHDDDILELFVKQAVERYGPPTATAWWSRPKKPAIRSRNAR